MPGSLYEAEAGTIIPAVMLGAINSDLPGQILGQVQENVYDSDTGEHLLIPQGTRLVGALRSPHRVRPGARPDHLDAAHPPERLEPEPEGWDARDGRAGGRRVPRTGQQSGRPLRGARRLRGVLPRSARRGHRAVGASPPDPEHLPGCLPRVPYVAAPHRRS